MLECSKSVAGTGKVLAVYCGNLQPDTFNLMRNKKHRQCFMLTVFIFGFLLFFCGAQPGKFVIEFGKAGPAQTIS